jgi:hypothetical protein
MPPAKNPADKPNKDVTPAKPVEDTPQVPANSDPTEQTPENHDETDVAAALQRKTQDGKGPDPVPETDFDSFATAGVEKGDLLSVEEVTREVLGGRWGADAQTAAQRLQAAGYDLDAVEREYRRRKDGGAPSAF